MSYYTIDLSLRDPSLEVGNQLVDARFVFRVEVENRALDEMNETWNHEGKMAQLRLSKVEVTGDGIYVYWSNTRYVRGNFPPDSSAKQVRILHLGPKAHGTIRQWYLDMLNYELKKRELQQQKCELRDEINAAGFDCFKELCAIFKV